MSSRAAGWGILPPELQQEVLKRVPKWSKGPSQPWRRRDLALVCKSFAAALRGLQCSVFLFEADVPRLEDPAAVQSLLVAADRRPGITRLCALVSREAQVAAVAVLVQRLPRLRELDLEGRPEDDDPDIDLLPPGMLDCLPALQHLKLCNPASLPSSLGRLTALRHLRIEASYDLPIRLPEAVACLGALASVDLCATYNDLDCPVEGVHHLAALPHLTALSLAHVQLHSLEVLQGFTQLQQLHLHTCVGPPDEEEPDPDMDQEEQLAIRRFPTAAFEAALQPLTQLTRLELERCFLEQVPDCIASLTRLCHLDLYRNDIKRIPDELFSHLQQLTHLGLAGNAFVGLPHSLGALPQLAELNLSDNSWLRDLPPGSYPALKDLRLADCIFLQSGPVLRVLHSLTSLAMLSLDGTPLAHRRPQFLRLLAALPSLELCWPPTCVYGGARPNRALLAAARHQRPDVRFITY